MTKSPVPHLALIRAALSAIEQYRPVDEAAFLAQPMVQDAILMRLQEIGENLARLRRLDEDAFAAASPDSWLRLIGLRNVISHGYHQIKPATIWELVTNELPGFTASLSSLDRWSNSTDEHAAVVRRVLEPATRRQTSQPLIMRHPPV